MPKRFHNSRNDAGSLLASVFILTLGFGCCLFLVAIVSPKSFANTAWGLGGVLCAFLTLIVHQRFGKVPNANLGFLFSTTRNRRDDGVADYEPRIAAGQSRSSSPVGTNQPISAQEAHEIKVMSANTWVPVNSRRRQKK